MNGLASSPSAAINDRARQLRGKEINRQGDAGRASRDLIFEATRRATGDLP
jgi:hypothetical protein